MAVTALHKKGFLSARPGMPGTQALAPGTHPLGDIGLGRGLYHVPPVADPARARALLVMLHGAGAGASDVLPMVRDVAQKRGIIVLLPESQGATWDLLQSAYGPDVAHLDAALAGVFERVAINPERIALAGFSDGGSYALSVGLADGELFSDLIAFSPGFVLRPSEEAHPRIFVSHGREDPVLPIARCGRRVAESLARAGHDIDYREFSGGHVVPDAMVEAALERALRE